MSKSTTGKPTRLVIENKGVGGRHEKQFFLDIQSAIIDGYRISESTKNIDSTMRNYMGFMGRAVLVLPEFQPNAIKAQAVEEPTIDVVKVEVVVEEKTPEVTPEVTFSEDTLAAFTKKKDLIAYAKSLGFEVPKELTAPMQIKKTIKEHFTK